MNILIKDISQLQVAARKLLEFTSGKKILAFYGSMGAGKTTIIKALCKELGVTDPVSSPTFTLVNEYLTKDGDSVYHIDFYRIKKLEEVFDFGIEEYFTGESFCLMEWPELIEEILPSEAVSIRITVDSDEARMLSITEE